MGHAKRAKCSSRQKILHLSLALRNEPSGALRRASCYCQAPAPPPTKHHPPAVVPLSPPHAQPHARSEHGRFKPMASSRLSTTGLQEHVKDMCWGSSGGFPSARSGGQGRWFLTKLPSVAADNYYWGAYQLYQGYLNPNPKCWVPELSGFPFLRQFSDPSFQNRKSEKPKLPDLNFSGYPIPQA